MVQLSFLFGLLATTSIVAAAPAAVPAPAPRTAPDLAKELRVPSLGLLVLLQLANPRHPAQP
jgi:hypothetical protein